MHSTQPNTFYKAEAKAAMRGQYPDVILFAVVMSIATSIAVYVGSFFAPVVENTVVVSHDFPYLYILINLMGFALGAMVAYGYTGLFFVLSKREQLDVKRLLKQAFTDYPVRSIAIRLLKSVFLTLWMLVFLFPAVIKAYAYSMSYYVALQGETDPLAAITTSRQLMHGHKSALFMLDLSYLGWYLLGIFTLGIIWIWIIPRHMTARMLMFNDLYVQTQPEPFVEKLHDDPFAIYER